MISVTLRTLRFTSTISSIIAVESLLLTLMALLWDQAVWVVLITIPLFAVSTVFAGWCFRLLRTAPRRPPPPPTPPR